ncbi:MAG: hypothetical protein GY935_12790 [Gammaproteobacteria bacterium]|nr:hypothetical protein [Gammaproteobacteria bacterium]
MSQQIINSGLYRVMQNRLQADTLSLFRGHYSPHRVSPVKGKRQRIQTILGYSTQAKMLGSKESGILHYGSRVAEIEARNPHYPEKVVI